jgi:hypothetical protein
MVLQRSARPLTSHEYANSYVTVGKLISRAKCSPVDVSTMNLQLESTRAAEVGRQQTSIAAVKNRLTAELQDLTRVNGEITAQVRKIQRVVSRLRKGDDSENSSKSGFCQLLRACRIALLESEESQTALQIQARIERRASFGFLGSECAASMIGQALEEMAAAGEVLSGDGFWARPTHPEPTLARKPTSSE